MVLPSISKVQKSQLFRVSSFPLRGQYFLNLCIWFAFHFLWLLELMRFTEVEGGLIDKIYHALYLRLHLRLSVFLVDR